MKEKYIDLMEKVLSAYTDEHILRYLGDVRTNGLTEHGFPRLTVNIGVLISHGRRTDLLPYFMEMMELCCDMMLRPYIKAANEFSVREIVCCIKALEDAGTVDEDTILRWKKKIAAIVPEKCYNFIVGSETDRITNWAIFGAVSEYARFCFGLSGDVDFVDRQLSCQFQWLDENGMYMDNPDEPVHQPIMYDFVSRALFAMLLHFGYRGRYFARIDACLKRAGLLTLKMQSSTGEIPFGGRSNQFLHNEAWMMLLFEYEARRYAKEGKIELAKTFKAAISKAFDITEAWLCKHPIRHIKNKYPTETEYGCEEYAYFDKYMISAASNLYAAYLLCDDSIPTPTAQTEAVVAFQTTEHFHKLFLRSGGYAVEFDTNGDPHYDATGLGRVQKNAAPSNICLACPCPAKPRYVVDTKEPFAFSMCSAVFENDGWRFGSDEGTKYEVINAEANGESASATISCKFADGKTVREGYTVSKDGVSVCVDGDGRIGYTLPAFCFDGETTPSITVGENELTVEYEGWICRYTTDGVISDMKKTAANRNGHYRTFIATSQNTVNIKIQITKA